MIDIPCALINLEIDFCINHKDIIVLFNFKNIIFVNKKTFEIFKRPFKTADNNGNCTWLAIGKFPKGHDDKLLS